MQGMASRCVDAYHGGMATDFLGYLDRISDGATRAAIAKAAGVSGSTVTRWDPTRDDYIPPRADAVIALAYQYGVPPLEALIAAGILTERDARVTITDRPLSDYTNASLVRELERRLEMSHPTPMIGDRQEEPNPDDYDLAAGNVARPDDQPAD